MEAPHHDALTHQALRGIALMSTESIQPNCSNNAAWNDPSAGMGLRLLALLGSVVLTLFNPQVRIDRRGFAIGLVGWLLAAAAAYALMDSIADAAWISDSAILVIAKIYGWAAGLWSIGVTVLCARRAHDFGLSGAWALLLSAAGVNILFLLACLCLPGRPEGLAWPRADDAAELFHGTHQTVCRNE